MQAVPEVLSAKSMAKLLGASFGTVLAARELTSNDLDFPHSSELPKPIVNWLRVKLVWV